MSNFPKNKDPNNPTDLFDRPIDVGDYIAWPTQSGSSAATITVGRIVRINFTKPRIKYRHDGEPYEAYGEYSKACPPDAKRYTVTAQPIKYTGYYNDTEYDPDAPEGQKIVKVPVKLSTIQNVANLVKVDLPDGE